MTVAHQREFLKTHWFKIGVLILGLGLIAIAWHGLVAAPAQERAAQAVKDSEEKYQAEFAQEQRNSNREKCFSEASDAYDISWKGACELQAKNINAQHDLCMTRLEDADYCSRTYPTKIVDPECGLSADQAARFDAIKEKAENRCIELYPTR